MRLLSALTVLFGWVLSVSAQQPTSGKFWVYIGTYTGSGANAAKGIYRCEFDPATGKLSTPELAAEVKNPSFLALHPSGKFLYSVGETADSPTKKGTGSLSSFAIDVATGKLTPLNQQSSEGAGPCHVTVDKSGKFVLTANYGGGSAAVLPIKEDGSLGQASGFVQHVGSSVNPGRQKEPHAHSVNIDPSNSFVVVADLGIDKVLVYKLDRMTGKLVANEPAAYQTKPGAGPRHFAFHPTRPFAFVINELDLTLDSLRFDAESGSFTKIGSYPTVPSDAPRKGVSTAEVVVHPNGKFVYGSNRGHNTIVCFAIDEKSGELTYVAHQGEGIKIPRNFNIDPTGKYLLVANQDGRSVIVFAIDQATGKLTPTESKVEVANPVCIKFLAKP